MGKIHDQINAIAAERDGLIAARSLGLLYGQESGREQITGKTRQIRAIRNQAAAALKLDVLPWDSGRKKNCIIVSKFGQDFLVEAVQKNGGSFLDPRGLHQVYLQATNLSTGKVHRWNGARKERIQSTAMPTGRRTDRVIGVQVDPATGEESPIYEVVEDPAAAALAHFRHAALLGITEEPATDATKEFGNTTTVVYPDAGNATGGSVDGRLEGLSTNDTWANVRNHAGYAAYPTASGDAGVRVRTGSSAGTWSIFDRSIFTFDTTPVGDDAVSAATMSVTQFNAATSTQCGDSSVDCVSAAPAADDALVAGDFDSLGAEVFGQLPSVAALSLDTQYDIALNASGIAAINGGGITALGLRLGFDTADNEPSWPGSNKETSFPVYYADYTGTARDPKATIEHAAAAAGGGGASVASKILLGLI